MTKDPRLSKIIGFFHRNKRMPTYAEIMKLFGFKSKNAASKLVKRLRQFDQIGQDARGRLLPGQPFRGVPLLGTVEAGWPSPAEEELLDTMSLEDYLIKNKEATFMLRATGDSMIGEGIKDGDLVLVERRKDAKDGQIVIAEVDGGWTMKYLRKKNGKIYLEAANEKYPPIYPKNSLKIAAVVKGIIRKY